MLLMRCLIIFLFFVFLIPPASAKDLTADELRRVCAAAHPQDRRNCEAYLRGVGERLQTLKIYLDEPCRQTPINVDDVQQAADFLEEEKFEEDVPAHIYALKYWIKSGIPCLNQGHFTSVQELQNSCLQDNSGKSSCKFYIESLMQIARYMSALAKKPIFCPEGKTQKSPYIISDEEVMRNFNNWIKNNPDLKQAPAALGFIDSQAVAYPCPKQPS